MLGAAGHVAGVGADLPPAGVHPAVLRDVLEGKVTKVPREESEAYFHSRPRASQLGAWGSQQSTVISGRSSLEDSMKMLEQKYAGREIPLPPNWGGWRLSPDVVEFWQGRPSRLHDRLLYTRSSSTTDGGWTRTRLAP